MFHAGAPSALQLMAERRATFNSNAATVVRIFTLGIDRGDVFFDTRNFLEQQARFQQDVRAACVLQMA